MLSRLFSFLHLHTQVHEVLNAGFTYQITKFYTDYMLLRNRKHEHRPIDAACFSRCRQLTNSSTNLIRAALKLFVTISAGSWTTGGPCVFVLGMGHDYRIFEYSI